MPSPSQLAIATSALTRLVKEEASYHKEAEQQQASIAKLERDGGDENAEYQLRQERRALDETQAIFPELRVKIQEALAKLEQQLEQGNRPGDQSTPEDITKAKEAVASGLKAIRETS